MSGLIYHTRNDDFSAEEKVIRNGLNAYADQEVGLTRQFAGVFCHDGDKMVGGVVAHIIGGSLSIKLLWVDLDYRGQSIGGNLMKKVEDYACGMGIRKSFVDTMSFQAPEFYIKVGYSEEARIKDFYAGYDRVFYKKVLKE